MRSRLLHLGLLLALGGFVSAQDATVRGTVNVIHSAKNVSGNSDVVIWLTDIHSKQLPPPGPMSRLLQKDKRFTPHVVVVTVGTAIEFPNRDPYFHDVFSIYHGKPFDLGLYESGAVRKVKFSESGVSYIFCNIHPEMSAVVVALSTPYFALTSGDGSFHIEHVLPGEYKLEVWYEHAPEQELTAASLETKIVAGDNSLPAITLHASDGPQNHLNKYGEPYPAAKPSKY